MPSSLPPRSAHEIEKRLQRIEAHKDRPLKSMTIAELADRVADLQAEVLALREYVAGRRHSW